MIISLSNIGSYITTAPNANIFVITVLIAVLFGYEIIGNKKSFSQVLKSQKVLSASIAIGWVYWLIGFYYYSPEKPMPTATNIAGLIVLMCGILGALSILKIMIDRKRDTET